MLSMSLCVARVPHVCYEAYSGNTQGGDAFHGKRQPHPTLTTVRYRVGGLGGGWGQWFSGWRGVRVPGSGRGHPARGVSTGRAVAGAVGARDGP